MMVDANMAGYLVVGVGGLVLGTLFGSKVTTAMMSMAHGLEARIAKVEGSVGLRGVALVSGTEKQATAMGAHAAVAELADAIGKHAVESAAEKQAAAIGAHAAAVAKLAEAIEKHALAVDEHGAATVAAAVEAHAATIMAGK